MSDEYVKAGVIVENDETETSKKGEIDTHEKFMREASKQMVETLGRIEKDTKSIASWVLFFGIVAILGVILGGCNLLMSF